MKNASDLVSRMEYDMGESGIPNPGEASYLVWLLCGVYIGSYAKGFLDFMEEYLWEFLSRSECIKQQETEPHRFYPLIMNRIFKFYENMKEW